MVLAHLLGPEFVALGVVGAAVAVVAIANPRWTLYAALVAIPLERVALVPGSVLTPTESLMALLAVGSVVSSGAGERRGFLGGSAAVGAFGVFLVATAVSALFAVDPLAAAKVAFMTTVLFLVLRFVVVEGDAAMVHGILIAVTAAAAIVSFLVLTGFGGSSQTYSGVQVLSRKEGVFAHPNTLATFYGMALPCAVVLALTGAGRRRAVGVGAVLLLAIGLLSTFSRGGLLAAGASALVLCAMRSFRTAVVLAVALVVFVVSTGAHPLGDAAYLDVVSERVATIRDASAGDDPRVGIWRGSLEMVGDRPVLGVGPGSFQVAAPAYGLYYPLGTDVLLVPSHAHDLLLNVSVERGLIAGLAFLCFLAFIAGRCLTAVRRAGRHLEARASAVGVSAALAAFVTQGVVDYTFATNAIALMVVTLCASAVLLARDG